MSFFEYINFPGLFVKSVQTQRTSFAKEGTHSRNKLCFFNCGFVNNCINNEWCGYVKCFMKCVINIEN
jgi:hypothetical protein